jgi:hypothetical protein
MRLLKNIGIAVVALGVACTLAIMSYTTSWEDGVDFTLIILYLWVLLPYFVLLVLTVTIHRRNASDASRIAIFIASVAVVILSVLSYYHSIFVSVSSTSALVFLVVPLYALAAIAVVYLVSWLLIRFLVRRRESS